MMAPEKLSIKFSRNNLELRRPHTFPMEQDNKAYGEVTYVIPDPDEEPLVFEMVRGGGATIEIDPLKPNLGEFPKYAKLGQLLWKTMCSQIPEPEEEEVVAVAVAAANPYARRNN
jgi:hypothetical protein